MDLTSLAPFALTAVSLLLWLTMWVAFATALRRHRRAPEPPLARAPLVTIQKPLAGDDDELARNLESFAALDYPAFEILFGVASTSDRAYPVACAFVARHPKLAARVVVTGHVDAPNPKVAQLIALERLARGEIVVISDSNVRVGARWLWRIVAELSQPGVGMATNLFVGTGEQTLGAALENLQLGAVCAPGIAAVSVLSKRGFTVGKSMAMWRRDLSRLGGFAQVAGVLAEDHALGRLVLGAGLSLRTILEPVENRNVACSTRRMIERHTRWAKMRRAISPTAFALEPLLSPLVIATASAAASPSRSTVAVVVMVAFGQTLASQLGMRALRGRGLRLAHLPLEVVRTYVAFGCWVRACVSRRVSWRGHAVRLLRGSRIEVLPEIGRPQLAGRWSLEDRRSRWT